MALSAEAGLDLVVVVVVAVAIISLLIAKLFALPNLDTVDWLVADVAATGAALGPA